MAFSVSYINNLIVALADKRAGNELAAAITSGSMLSSYTFSRLVIAMGSKVVAQNLQNAILGLQPLTQKDIAVMVTGFDSKAIAQQTASAVAGGYIPPAPPGFTPAPITPPVTPQVATPTFSPVAGSYSGTQFVTVSCATALVSMYYTIDGSTPTTSSTPVIGLITVGASETLKVLATKSGFTNSAIASAAYVITGSAGVATHLDWTTQPSASAANEAFATQPVITVKDVSNATVTTGPDATALITITLLTGTGALAGTVSMNAVAGVANFVGKGLNINTAGSKVLRATKANTVSGGGTINFFVDSNPLTIAGDFISAVNLNSAANYRILAKSGISTTAGTAITGDIAVSPIDHTAITGFGLILDGGGTFSTSALVTGEVFAADYSAPTPATLTSAVSDMMAAYTDAAGRTNPDFLNTGSGELGGLTLAPGLYKFTTGVTISTNVTLSGDASAVWIFQIPGTFSLATSRQILLSGGALPQNVFWQVAGASTLGVSSVFRGILLDATSIAVQTTATVHGKLYAQTAVTLDNDVISA